MRAPLRAVSIFLLLLALLLPSVLLISCADGNEEDIGFRDSLGRSVNLSDKPERVAVLFSSLAEVWQLSGGAVSVSVGESVTRGFCTSDTPLVHSDSGGVGKSINAELLIAERPDFVICTADYQAQLELEPLLSAVGIPVAYFRLDSFGDYLAALKTMTDITGRSDCFESYGTEIEEKINALISHIPEAERRILFVRATRSSAKAKLPSDHFAANMLDELGAENIASDAPVLIDGISPEVLLAENPDIIFISTMGDEAAATEYINSLFSRPEWAMLDAVKNEKYYILSKELFQYKPCHRWYDAYVELYGYLYE